MIKLFVLSLSILLCSCNSLIKNSDDKKGHTESVVSESHRTQLDPSIIIDGVKANDSLLFEIEGDEITPVFIVGSNFVHPAERDDVGCWVWKKSYEGTVAKKLAAKEILKEITLVIYDKEYPLSKIATVESSKGNRFLFKLKLDNELLQGESYIELKSTTLRKDETIALGFMGLKEGCRWKKEMSELGLFRSFNEIFVRERKYHISYKVLRTS